MGLEAVITISKSDLQKALKRWDEEAKAGNWQDNLDGAEKAKVNAEYLFGLLTGN